MHVLFQIAAISEEASDSDGENADSAIGSSVPFRWKSFDMRSVVAATEDLLLFILSEKGLRVRQYLVRDILKAVDALLQEDLVACIFDGCSIEMNTSISEVCLVLFIFLFG